MRLDKDCDPALVDKLRAAAVAAPELAEYLEPVIHDDAVLIDADIEIGWCRERLADDPPALTDPLREASRIEGIKQQLAAALELVATTGARTPKGEAIKAKHLGSIAT